MGFSEVVFTDPPLILVFFGDGIGKAPLEVEFEVFFYRHFFSSQKILLKAVSFAPLKPEILVVVVTFLLFVFMYAVVITTVVYLL